MFSNLIYTHNLFLQETYFLIYNQFFYIKSPIYLLIAFVNK